MKEHEATGVCQKKPTKLRNLIYKTEAFDSLHAGNAEVHITKETSRAQILFSLFSLSPFTYVCLLIFFSFILTSHWLICPVILLGIFRLEIFGRLTKLKIARSTNNVEVRMRPNECGRICESILSKNESSFRWSTSCAGTWYMYTTIHKY